MINELSVAVVHDVKNQLAELALMLARRDDCVREKAIAFSAAQRLSGLLLAQMQHDGLLRAHVNSASPLDLLQELEAGHRALFPHIEIRVEADRAPAFWFYDAALLRLALDNAVHNACRHARSCVKLEASENNGQLEIHVADDGAGFPAGILNGQAGAAPVAASNSGTGLGLYLAARIAHLHENNGKNGVIELANDGGGVFLMRLP